MEPGILSGRPAFPEPIPWVRPTLPALAEIAEPLSDALARGQITNGGPYVQRFEEQLAEYLGAHCVCVASGTAGLTLVASILSPARGVLVPAFTFPATALAFVAATRSIVLGDVLEGSWCLDPADARDALDQVDLVVPVNVYGHPPEVEALDGLTGCAVVYDSAHGLGSAVRGRRVGSFGTAEVFSLHATKVLACGEGGLVSTRDEALARELRLRRNFGLQAHVSRRVGTNAKMQEFSAVLGLWGLPHLDAWIAHRACLVEIYRTRLAHLPGIGVQTIEPHVRSNHVNFPILVGEAFGLSRAALAAALLADNVTSRAYFSPDLTGHPSLERAAAPLRGRLPERSRRLGREVLCLPLSSRQTEGETRSICDEICRIYEHRDRIRRHRPAEREDTADAASRRAASTRGGSHP
jgi:dTDP-4-amino-4,6-dideoxyglucose